MIASGWREQSQGTQPLGKDVLDGVFMTKEPLSILGLGQSPSEFAPTAPPLVDSEVELVTNSACQCLLEAFQLSQIASGFNQIAPIWGAIRAQSGMGHVPRLHPTVYTDFHSRTLSAPTVSST